MQLVSTALTSSDLGCPKSHLNVISEQMQDLTSILLEGGGQVIGSKMTSDLQAMQDLLLYTSCQGLTGQRWRWTGDRLGDE